MKFFLLPCLTLLNIYPAFFTWVCLHCRLYFRRILKSKNNIRSCCKDPAPLRAITMSTISGFQSAPWVFLTTVLFTLGNSLPQEMIIRREINSTNCNDEVYPTVNITSYPLSYRDRNITEDLTRTLTPSVILTCYEYYPVEWVFQHRLSVETVVSILERREWIPSGDGKPRQRFLIEVRLIVTSSVHNVTCRAARKEQVCRQTTVKFVTAEMNGINTTTADVYQGFPKGELLHEYSNVNDGNNINCSLYLHYNYEDERFECYSKNNDSLTSMNESALLTLSAVFCYDSFSCGLLYNRKVTENCKSHFQRESHYLLGTLPLDPTKIRDYRTFTGILTCKLQRESTKIGENSDSSQMVSASSHFFQAAAGHCEKFTSWDWKYGRHFYVDVDPLSLSDEQHLDFIALCGIDGYVFLGQERNVTCHTSVYLFAEGVQIKITMRNGFERELTGIKLVDPLKTKNKGYRSYFTNISINSMQISGISISAPRKKSPIWVVKLYTVDVRRPEQNRLKLVGNVTETVWAKRDSDVVLKCSASGGAYPPYEWKYLETGSPLPREWGSSSDLTDILTIPARNVSSATVNSVVCIVKTEFQSIEKTFTLKLESSDPSNWSAINVFVIVIVLIVVVGVVTVFVGKMIHMRNRLRLLSQVEIDGFMNGNPEFRINSGSSTEYDINSYSTCLPYNNAFEVLKEQLEIETSAIIGSGAYGIVLRGFLTTNDTEKIQVAIKTCKPMDDVSYLKALMSELKIMGFIGKHDNIVNLLGACTNNLQHKEIFIAIQFCENGCLLNYLRSHRENFVDQTLEPTLKEMECSSLSNVLKTTGLLKWSMQISNGMNFLCQKKVIHGDLAARNVLLSSDLTAKIGDFGLSRQLFEYANYIKKQQSPLPWKWLAIESLQDMKFSPQSDVWAYGITLWEIFTLGYSPFPGCTYNADFINSLVAGERPGQPQHATRKWYGLMAKCWVSNPSERPSFADISAFFDNEIRTITQEDYMNIDFPSETYSVFPATGAKKTYIDKPDEDLGVLSVESIQNEEK